MLKIFKYLYLANLYKRAKKSFLMLFIYSISLMLVVFIINDIISVTSSASVYFLILIKWATTISLLVLIVLSLAKILNTAMSPLKSESDSLKNNPKKKSILAKEKLTSMSDAILQKYKNRQG